MQRVKSEGRGRILDFLLNSRVTSGKSLSPACRGFLVYEIRMALTFQGFWEQESRLRIQSTESVVQQNVS